MKKIIFFTILFSSKVFSQIDCEIPIPNLNINTGNNMTVMLHSNFISSVEFESDNPFLIVYNNSNELVLGLSLLGTEDLINGSQALTIWGDDSITPEIDGATNGENLIIKIVDGVKIYDVNQIIQLLNSGQTSLIDNLSYSSNGIQIVYSAELTLNCIGEIYGCMDENACNFDIYATENINCVYPNEFYNCSGNCLNDYDFDEICDELEIFGCIEPMACNYNSFATEELIYDESNNIFCIYPNQNNCESCSGEIDGSGTIIYFDNDFDDICDTVGCSDFSALNFNPFSLIDDGSCEYLDLVNEKKIEISVFPNPSKNNLFIEGNMSSSIIEFLIFDRFGNLILKKNKEKNNNLKQRLDISDLTSGFYFLKIQVHKKTIYKKFVKH